MQAAPAARRAAVVACARARGVRCFGASAEPDIQVTHYKRSGAGPQRPPLFIMHGLLGSSSNFRSIAANDKLSGPADVFTIDLRNHGRSGHSRDASIAAMADDLLRVASERAGPTGEFDVLGHSLGGKVAMAAALRSPERVRRLVVADISPVPYDASSSSWQEVSAVVQAVARTRPQDLTHRSQGQQMLEDAGVDPAYRGFILQNLVPRKPSGFDWRCNVPVLLDHMAEFAGFPFDPVPSPLSPPQTVFIRGARSDYVSERLHGAAIERMFPGARIESIEGAGHFVHAEKPAEFIEAVARALE
ncbi:hypothetical protein FNF29_00486 [Cafeteria roenbergensis]|uniref:AB hydrolase-1 domain-containing protein n=1 Tax=Cafeteria roenbergensis TaxID=33653 RepID=A0A5A8DU10_CAFRO|nr:hypothetical protein FNF28_07295 [Cafeteria roenbergensis]KAA0157134.1 hypothetical protein FNF29_00486 [Cafeteria roenbergensis]KAA0168972.1 hypothetical protein FNF31_00133 [Cafeteria roenbergensis]|eukprot:KAA0157134.1 hypothetical protein FNF29_00486 [Cafeteria roenbergensis]